MRRPANSAVAHGDRSKLPDRLDAAADSIESGAPVTDDMAPAIAEWARLLSGDWDGIRAKLLDEGEEGNVILKHLKWFGLRVFWPSQEHLPKGSDLDKK